MSRLGIRTAVPALPWQKNGINTGPRGCDHCRADNETPVHAILSRVNVSFGRLDKVGWKWLCPIHLRRCKEEGSVK